MKYCRALSVLLLAGCGDPAEQSGESLRAENAVVTSSFAGQKQKHPRAGVYRVSAINDAPPLKWEEIDVELTNERIILNPECPVYAWSYHASGAALNINEISNTKSGRDHLEKGCANSMSVNHRAIVAALNTATRIEPIGAGSLRLRGVGGGVTLTPAAGISAQGGLNSTPLGGISAIGRKRALAMKADKIAGQNLGWRGR